MLRQDTPLYFALLRKQNLDQRFCPSLVPLIKPAHEVTAELSEQLDSVNRDTSEVIYCPSVADRVQISLHLGNPI